MGNNYKLATYLINIYVFITIKFAGIYALYDC
jgi:hypothetical protein